ncbi:MAG: alpha-glucan family phosphorylase, partial [Nitrososphaerales archaeon]
RRIFERIDQAAWDGLGHNPILLLRNMGRARLQELASSSDFKSAVAEARDDQRSYLHQKEGTWFARTYGVLQKECLIAYFSAEFGFAECFKIYSGGLGILSGDHLKSASDLGIPLVGVGLFYKRGYFSQGIDPHGWQTESYPENNPGNLPCKPVLEKDSQEPLIISIPMEERQVRVRAWKASIGRVSLLLLDSDVPGLNSREDCEITGELYGGDSETRIKQEMILGFGGTKLLRALGISPTVFHMNEGHAAFVTLERIRETIESSNGSVSFAEARNLTGSSNVFTTHTPVPAGIDVFDEDKMDRYLSWYCKKTGISHRELLDLGRERDSQEFNMATLAIRLSGGTNAVSKLHREVAQKIWENLLAAGDESMGLSSRIDCVTNGIHIPSWISDQMAEIFEEYIGSDWTENTEDDEIWSRVKNIPDLRLWEARCEARADLIEYIRNEFSFSGHRASSGSILDPKALTIGFSRRFATYKRANLILRDKERLARMLNDSARPVQFIFSGKSHPRDHEAKKIIQEIVHFAKSEISNGRLIFLQDYDIYVARRLVSGVDLWLNNPRRPHEACGTSGMKALPNGVLNLSVLDGWWAEAYSSGLGWAIGEGAELADHREQDRLDAESLYEVLEKEVIPEFYEREDGIPRRWMERMKLSISTLSPKFNTGRMLMEYSQKLYFKKYGEIAGRLNKSEFGTSVLEAFSTRWDEH